MITLGELFKIVKSLALSDIIDLKRCYYLHYIRDPVEKCYLHGFYRCFEFSLCCSCLDQGSMRTLVLHLWFQSQE